MGEYFVCSNCFRDQGLKLFALHIGLENEKQCPNCNTINGKKLDNDLLDHLASEFFIRGSIQRFIYGFAPAIKFRSKFNGDIEVPEWLKEDVKLIEKVLEVGFFDYGPSAWMYGEIEPLKSLQSDLERNTIIQRILKEYPQYIYPTGDLFYRLRPTRPRSPSNPNEYDSRPLSNRTDEKYGRFDSKNLSVMYASQNIQICIHECKATVEKDSFLATLSPKRDLKLLDLTTLLQENVTEFESLDLALHVLFLAGEHSYDISRQIAISAQRAGFDGLIYPSFFSLALTGAWPLQTFGYGNSIRRFPKLTEYAKSHIIPNIALFGRPIEEDVVKVECINRLIIKRAYYDIQFGPVQY